MNNVRVKVSHGRPNEKRIESTHYTTCLGNAPYRSAKDFKRSGCLLQILVNIKRRNNAYILSIRSCHFLSEFVDISGYSTVLLPTENLMIKQYSHVQNNRCC